MPPPDIASTYLNLCAIYSELGHHSEAINKAVKSILLLKNFLLTRLQQNDTDQYDSSELDKVIRHGQSNKSLKFLFGKRMEPTLIKMTEDINVLSGISDGTNLLNI